MRTLLLACFTLFAALPSAVATDPARQETIRPYLASLSVPDIDASAAWYSENLGFKVVKKMDFPDYKLRITLLDRDGFRLELVQLGGSVPPAKVLPEWGSNPALLHGFGKLAFQVADVDAWAGRLKEKGIKFQIEPRDNAEDGTRSFIVLDRDGNWIQLVGPLPRR